MSLLFFDGCEGQDSTYLYDSWTLCVYSGTTRFSSGLSIQTNNAIANFMKKYTASTDAYIGFAFMTTALNNEFCRVYGDSGTTIHLSFVAKTDGAIEVRRGNGGTILATTAAGLLATSRWVYIEIKANIHDTTGSVEVRLNGSPTAALTFSGDTKNGGTNNSSDAWALLNGPGNNWADDIYICDGLGSVNNGFLGDIRVQTLFPTGAGASTGLTPSTGSNWQTVDEAPPVQTDYSGSVTSGARDSYAMTDLAAGTTVVKGVRQMTAWHKSDAGAKSMKRVTRVGSTNYYGADTVLPSSMAVVYEYFETSPATSTAWTVSEVNGMEAGAEVV